MNQKLSIVEDLNCIWTGHSICGEGPLWIPEEQALYWVDIDGCKAHRFQLEGGEVKSWVSLRKRDGFYHVRGDRISSKDGILPGKWSP